MAPRPVQAEHRAQLDSNRPQASNMIGCPLKTTRNNAECPLPLEVTRMVDPTRGVQEHMVNRKRTLSSNLRATVSLKLTASSRLCLLAVTGRTPIVGLELKEGTLTMGTLVKRPNIVRLSLPSISHSLSGDKVVECELYCASGLDSFDRLLMTGSL